MKRLVFLIVGAAALSLGACSGSNEDAVNNAELNQPAAEDLNALANDAAVNAEDQALSNQVELNDQNAAGDNGPNPSEAQEQNIDAM
ncbi:MAG TPA: circumsporozoite protein [Sphingomicrobium sp.]|nr:circumsporozoite protein [Sphingomicrobium sp.]